MIGRQIGHFEILEEIGSGGMGTVYRARDTLLRRTVALKTLPEISGSDDQRRRFLAEARAASALNHPGIVTVYEVGSEDGVDFIAMELVTGRTLTEILADGPLGEKRAREISVAIADALVAAHAEGIVHRDLKPGNVMATPDGRVKVLDFGLAKRISLAAGPVDGDQPTLTAPELTATGAVLGTPAYMSPEQAKGERADRRSDLFSLGCVLYEMLTGERPFSGGSPVELLSSILRDEPELPSRRAKELSDDWDPIVRRLLAKEPAARYARADEVVRDLRKLGASKPASAGSEKRSEPNRRIRAVGLSTALAVAVAIGLGLLLFSKAGDSPPEGPGEPTVGDSFPEYRFRLLLDAPGSEREPSLSPDGKLVAFVTEDEIGVPQIWVMDLAGGEPIQITEGDVPAGEPFWSGRGDRILFHRENDGIWEVPPLGGTPHRLVERGAYPALSPEGELMAFTAERRPWIAGGGGGDPRPVPGFEPSFFGYFGRPAFSPDGERIVTFWSHPKRPLGDLWTAPVGGDDPSRLTDLQFMSWGQVPVWSSDGRWIVFTSDHGGSVNLWRISSEGSELEPVTTGAGSDYSPDLSPDMTRLVYANGRNVARIAAFDPESGSHRAVHERRNQIILPELSPEGRRVAYFARAPGGFHLFVADLSTGQARQVTHGEDVINTHPFWSADGETLYFYQQEPTLSYRRISVEGRGDELVFDGWRWPVENQTHPSPDETMVAYTLRDAGELVETRVRDLETGDEHTLSVALHDPRWSEDGEKVFGCSWGPYECFHCAADGASCEKLAEGGWSARLGPGEASLYVLRGSPPVVWRIDLETGAEEELHPVEHHESTDFGWGVTPDGTVIHHAQHAEDLELWLGEAVTEEGE